MSPVWTTQYTRQIITKTYLSLLYVVMILNVCHKCDPGLNNCLLDLCQAMYMQKYWDSEKCETNT